MRNIRQRRLQAYRTSRGREPFTEWLISVHDRNTRNKIERRLDRIISGNFGDYRSVGAGVFELRFSFGAGYRIYFGEVDDTIVLLLCGGDKSSQAQDIERAKRYWLEYKEVQE